MAEGIFRLVHSWLEEETTHQTVRARPRLKPVWVALNATQSSMFSGLKKAVTELPQPTGSFELIHRSEASSIFKFPIAFCLRERHRKHGKHLTENYTVI